MSDPAVILNLLAGMVVVLTATASAVAFFRTRLAKATIDTLRESNDALTARVRELEDAGDRLRTENAKCQAKIETLEALVTRRPELEAMAADVAVIKKAVLR